MAFYQNWPAELQPAIAAVYKHASASARPSISIAVRKYGTWSAETHGKITISADRLTAFNCFLRSSICRKSADWQTRHIYTIGTRGPDKMVRDRLFESHVDTRRSSEIISEKWWPSSARLLAARAQFADNRRVLSELDSYFRCRDRIGHSEELRLSQLFLEDGLSDRTRYQKLSRLCIGLEAIAPQEPDHVALREAQSALYSIIWPPSQTPPRRKHSIVEVENVLMAQPFRKTGEPYAPTTLQSKRNSLNLLHKILSSKDHSFDFSKGALDLFADYAFAKYDIWRDPLALGGWCRRSVATHIMNLSTFIPDKELQQKWNAFGQHFTYLAKKKGDPKRKERALAARPMTLVDFFAKANRLLPQAQETQNIQTRYGIYIIVGALGILLFYPLRKSDLLRIRIGVHLKRGAAYWILNLGHTQKTSTPTEQLKLPKEATPLLDAAILRGAHSDHFRSLYNQSYGHPLLKSPRRSAAYDPAAFSALFSRWTGHSPHILRSIWCDEMVAEGRDRMIIGLMLQHGSLISQQDYEVYARKIRLKLAANGLSEIARDIECG